MRAHPLSLRPKTGYIFNPIRQHNTRKMHDQSGATSEVVGVKGQNEVGGCERESGLYRGIEAGYRDIIVRREYSTVYEVHRCTHLGRLR